MVFNRLIILLAGVITVLAPWSLSIRWVSADDQAPALIQNQVVAENDYHTLIEEIKNQQQALKKQAKEVADRLSAATPENQAEQLKSLQAEQESMVQLNDIYDQQITVLEQLQADTSKNQNYRQQIAQPKSSAAADRNQYFVELDRAREEFNVESRRKETLASKIDSAETALQQAKDSLDKQQKLLQPLESATSDADKDLVNDQLELARWQARLAEQTEKLRQYELEAQQLAVTVYKSHLELLALRIDFLQKHAVFSKEELQEQLLQIDKEKFNLNRDLSKYKDRQPGIKNRLDKARKKLMEASVDGEQNRQAQSEAETLRLQFEASKTEIDTLTRRIELLDERKTVWQRRYAVFNQKAGPEQLSKWRDEADSQIETIAQKQTMVNLWIDDWQNRLITLRNEIDNGQKTAAFGIGFLTRQREYVQTIIDYFQDINTALENSRRLNKKLIDEINTRTSIRSWRDWLDVTVHYEVYQNNLLDWLYALGSALTTFTLLYFLRWLLLRKFKHLEKANQISLGNGFLTSIKRANSIFFLILALAVGSMFLKFDSGTNDALFRLVKVAVVFQFTLWASSFLRVWIFSILVRKTKRDGASIGALSIFNFSSQVVLWSIAILLILQNFGIDVTALVAGLGIGGVAVALSLQRILSDLFSSLSIVLDKPFVVGDFIIFDDFMGSVEQIGIKTTRIRSLSGEQIVCPNADLLNARLRNYKRMQERRVVFQLGTVYETPAEKLEMLPGLIREIIEAQEKVRFDRAHFSSYGDFALLFEVVYYVLSPDYNLYMDIHQQINLTLFKRFQEAGIAFAYPTQSVYVQTTAKTDGQENLAWASL